MTLIFAAWSKRAAQSEPHSEKIKMEGEQNGKRNARKNENRMD